MQNNNYHHKIRVELESTHSDEFTRETAVVYWHKLNVVIFISLFCQEQSDREELTQSASELIPAY